MKFTEEIDRVDNDAVHQDLDGGFAICVDDILRDRAGAQILQHDRVALLESGYLGGIQERTADNERAAGRRKIYCLASADANADVERHCYVTVKIVVSIAGQIYVAGKYRRGLGSARVFDNVNGSVILEILRPNAGSGRGAGKRPVRRRRSDVEIGSPVDEKLTLIDQTQRAQILARSVQRVADRPRAGSGARRLTKGRRHRYRVGVCVLVEERHVRASRRLRRRRRTVVPGDWILPRIEGCTGMERQAGRQENVGAAIRISTPTGQSAGGVGAVELECERSRTRDDGENVCSRVEIRADDCGRGTTGAEGCKLYPIGRRGRVRAGIHAGDIRLESVELAARDRRTGEVE
ncbi:hypothetical protein [Mesorhizobium sp. 131-3-5]|uniref:hypothetical protein n=1 Tax=Mesorhizobium sp. 131-3-5 TaxID=2744520 RepID=UPI001FD3ED04|nr:hypothetical protein [Mesorhizobium sp. 131-3-5]